MANPVKFQTYTQATEYRKRLETTTKNPYIIKKSQGVFVVEEFEECDPQKDVNVFLFDDYSENTEALAKACAASLSQITGKSYQAIAHKGSNLFGSYFDYTVSVPEPEPIVVIPDAILGLYPTE